MENSDEPLSETPEDVAILYSWANLHGAKYRDFSASRREYRAQVRHRAAEELRRAELEAKAQAEASAADADRIVRDAERAARSAHHTDSAAVRETALRAADEASRRATAERVEAARRAEAAATAEAAARREEREIAEAHASAERQAQSYTNSEVRRRLLAGPQPVIPGVTTDPYRNVHGVDDVVQHRMHLPSPFDTEGASGQRSRDDLLRSQAQQLSGDRKAYRPELEIRRRPQGYRPDEGSGIRSAYRPAADLPSSSRPANQGPDFYGQPPYVPAAAVDPYAPRPIDRGRPNYAPAHEQPGPAWLYSSGATPVATPAAQEAGVDDTLQRQRERVASRWFALKGAFEPGQESAEPGAEPRELKTDVEAPLLAVFSLAGGVGKTSLVATLGRALSALGEKVLLADATSHGLLPYYFGASELRPGVVRTFSPPSGSTDAPIHLVSYAADQSVGDASAQEALLEQMAKNVSGADRMLMDLSGGSSWIVRKLARLAPTVLVPVSPDMNSVISLQTVERVFEGAMDREGRAILPYYVLNQFDAALPLHLDVREVLRRQLSDRLLPFTIRRAPMVSEALAEGMTVMDYAPDTGIAEDYLNIAGWLRNLAPPAAQGLRNIRWSER